MSRLVSCVVRSVCAIKSTSRSVLSRRAYSDNVNDHQPRVVKSQTHSGNLLYRNQTKPSDFDKKVLLWSGRYKKREDIPEYVSQEALSSARSNLRVKVCMAMIVSTVIGCILMVCSGKKALKENHTLLQMNMKKKAKWAQEAEKERDQTASLKNH